MRMYQGIALWAGLWSAIVTPFQLNAYLRASEQVIKNPEGLQQLEMRVKINRRFPFSNMKYHLFSSIGELKSYHNFVRK
ncbi:hypothetical protein GOV13_02600 [Candidatus Pacearchaeota archaeon]|nr:hypothetical protein [Candidatus Pacearchaeota archaeon]